MKRNLPISQKKKFKYSITFQSFDEESLEAGDSFDRGYEVEDTIDLIGDILYKAYSTYGIYMPVAFGTWESTNPLENTDFYEKGIQKYFAIHITNEDGTQISQEENDFITFILSDGNYELNKFREYAVGGVVLGSIALGIGALITYFYFKGKKGNKNGSSNNRAKSITHTINGKDRKFPIKDAWRKEHSLENQSEDYEVPQEERFEMGGYASEHYHEVEYGEGGVARAKEVIMNKIGFNEENANYLVSQSEKFSIWLADAILKQEIRRLNDLEKSVNRTNIIDKKSTLDFINKRNNHIQYGYSTPIREILDWLQHPITPKQDLKQLSFDQALIKAREWHNELQVLGGDIDFTEPETNTILKKYPVNSDGIEYYWVYIDSNYCDLESSRMGHCGRTGYGNKLISLRSVKPYGKGHTISDSHVTIAYGSDGTFYQVKGKKNNKPSEKYFPYIFDLIKSIISENGVEYSKESMNFDKTNKLYNEIRVLGFNGFGSEYGAEEDYGFEDMTEKEIREIFDLKPTLFESAEDNYMLLDAGIITIDELKEIVEREPETFSSFGNQMNLYEKGIITEQPSTTFELKYDCDEVYRLLDISRDFRDDLVAEVLCGDVGELSDGFSYYYDNPSDLISNLNKENEKRVIDEIVRITKLDESVVKKNGIEYYLNGNDENFSPNDDFDNIIRSLASAQNQADNNDYYNYLYKAIESALNQLGEVHSLNDEGVKMTIDLSNSMSLQEISEKMDYYEFTDVEDLFKDRIGEEIDTPFLSIDDRYSPYGSSEDFNEYISDTDLEQGYKKGGVLRTKNISTNKKIKNMKSTENKFADGGQIIRFDRHASMDSATRNELVEMTSYPFLLEYEVEENGQIKYDRIKSELKREGVSTEMIKNYLSGLFDGYNYSNTDAFKKEMAKLKLVDKEFYDKVMMLYEKISKYPKINVEYADGGRVTTNDGIIESFLTSNKQLKVGNLSTHFNQYDNQMLLRNYGTLIATRKGNDVSITNIKYSKTTTTITNKIRNIALEKRMNISYVDKFADGGETQKVNLGNGEMDLDEAIKIYEEKIKAQGRVVNARDEDVLEQLKRMKNKYADGGESDDDEYAKGGKAEKKYYWIKMDREKIDEYIKYASRMVGMFEGEIYTQAPNKVAFDTEDDMFAFTSMIENHNNDNDFQEGDEGYIYYEELYNGIPRPNIFDRIIGDKYAEGGKTGAVSKTKIQITDGEEGRKIATRTLIKENKNGERITYELLVGVFKDKKKGYFEIYATDSDDDEYFYAEGGLWIEGGRVVDYDGVYELSEKLKPLMSALNLNSVDVFAEGGETDDDDNDNDDNDDDDYAEGGKTGEKSTKKRTIKKRPKTREPKMVRQYFDDRPYSYAGGGQATLKEGVYNVKDRYTLTLKNEGGDNWHITIVDKVTKKTRIDEVLPKNLAIMQSLKIGKLFYDNDDYAEGGKVDILGLYKKDVFSEKDYELIDEAIENGDIDTTDIKEDFIGYIYERIDEEYKDNKFEDEQIWEYTDEYYENGLPHKENYKKLISYLNNEDEEGFAEGGEVSEWMEQALDSLIKETGNEDLDITMVSNNGNEFFAGNDMEEYRVFKTEEDAEQEAIEQVRDDLQESPENFNQDFIKNYIDGRDFFEAELNEMNYMYVEDISSETSGTKYNNRLIDELVENGLMDEDDAILENAEEIADELKYDYVLLLTEEKLDEGNDGLDYFINNFGENETYGMVVDNNLIDIDKASQDAVDIDGIAHFISSYDGRTLYLLNNNVAYRNN